jgi:hypothetical protein
MARPPRQVFLPLEFPIFRLILENQPENPGPAQKSGRTIRF